MATKYTVKRDKKSNEVRNKYFKFVFIESIFGEDTDNPSLYTIIFGNALTPEARNFSIYPSCTKQHEMAIQDIGIDMPDGGHMTCPYDMEKKELLIDETMWAAKGRITPLKKEYDIYNESIKEVVKFMKKDYDEQGEEIKPKFIDKNIEELCIVGDIKKY